MYILKKSAKKLKNIIFPLMATFYNFAFEIETSWANAANGVIVFILW